MKDEQAIEKESDKLILAGRYLKTAAILSFVVVFGAATTPPSCSGPTDQEISYLTTDLGVACNIVGAIDSTVRQNFNGNVQVAINDLEVFCPPSPPPTNWVQIAADLAIIATSIAPYVKSAVAKSAISNAQSIAQAHGVAPAQ